MAFLACCLYLLLIALVGYALLSAIHLPGRLTLVQLMGLGPALGAGAVGLLLFWASLMGFAPSRTVLAAIGALAVAGLVALRKNNRLSRIHLVANDLDEGDGWIVVPLFLILGTAAMMVAGAVSSPLSEWDAFSIWGFKAKVLAHEALRPTPACFHDLSLSYSHLDYPLMVPFLTAGAYAAMGTVDDQTGKLVSAFLDVLLVPMVYLGLRWKLRRLPATCLTAMLVLLPMMLQYGGTGYADLPLAMFYAGSIFYVARWIEQLQTEDLILAILFSAFAAFTKNEGMVLALLNGVTSWDSGSGAGGGARGLAARHFSRGCWQWMRPGLSGAGTCRTAMKITDQNYCRRRW